MKKFAVFCGALLAVSALPATGRSADEMEVAIHRTRQLLYGELDRIGRVNSAIVNVPLAIIRQAQDANLTVAEGLRKAASELKACKAAQRVDCGAAVRKEDATLQANHRELIQRVKRLEFVAHWDQLKSPSQSGATAATLLQRYEEIRTSLLADAK